MVWVRVPLHPPAALAAPAALLPSVTVAVANPLERVQLPLVVVVLAAVVVMLPRLRVGLPPRLARLLRAASVV